ncbi:MAG: class I SAM-dependent methyltransferase [Acidobacteriota bacterium]
MQTTAQNDARYQARLVAEEAYYRDRKVVHELPEIFHYWSEKYIRPKLQAAGFDSMWVFFTRPLEQQCDRAANQTVRFLSIGSGNCDTEIKIAEALVQSGRRNFVIDCLDLNETMLARGHALAAERGVAEHIHGVAGDFNLWQPDQTHHAALAVQALHHVVNLEGLFQAVKGSLAPGGCFIIHDMIGRNGHRRWPESMLLIHEYWRRLPPSYRYNHSLQRYEEMFQDWDCSQEGFEGIRAQDILPLLVENFQFHCFVPYGNLIDPFVDRAFGHNFDANAEWDLAFIDELHARDEQELASGGLTPTHMFAIVGNEPPQQFRGTPDPGRHIRRCDVPPDDFLTSTQSPYAWDSWPHAAPSELAIACQHLADASARAQSLQSDREVVHAYLTQLEKDFQDRSKWAVGLDTELKSRTKWALDLNGQFEERTQWALALQKEVEVQTVHAQQLAAQLAALRARLEFLPGPLKKLVGKLLR